MTIVEAFQTALSKRGKVRRLDWEEGRVISVEHELDVCTEKSCRWYAPTAEDLIAGDWIIVREGD